MSIGIWQIAIVVILVVLLFGRGKISSLMGDVAKGIKSFKKGMASDASDENEPKNIYKQDINFFMSIGIWQIAIVVILVVLLFGRGKISSLMGDVAKGIKSFKKGMASDVTDDTEPKNISDENKDSENKD